MSEPNVSFSIDFIGVGGEKTASSWLFTCLAEHPQICGSSEKETIFFDTTPIIGRPPRPQSDYEKEGIEGYKKFFAHCKDDAIRGEFTSTYLHDKNVAPLLRKLFPKVKIIVSLRHPIERAFSQYLALQARSRYRNFDDALVKEPELARRSLYAEYLKEYFERFPREQIHVVFYDDILKDPLKVVQDTYEFLGVNPSFTPKNLSVRERSREGKALTRARNRLTATLLGRGAYRIGRSLGLTAIGKSVVQSLTSEEKIGQQTRVKLKNIFRSDIESLERLTGRNLSHWK